MKHGCINYEYGDKTWKETRKLREAQLLPYLNLEVLRDDSLKVLGLLHFWTKFDPEDWVTFDTYQIRASWQLGGLQLNLLRAALYFTDHTTARWFRGTPTRSIDGVSIISHHWISTRENNH